MRWGGRMMTEKLIKVLLVEDNPADARLLEKLLDRTETIHFELVKLERLSDAVECLQTTQFNVILLDLGLPDSQGLNTVQKIYAVAPDIPIVVLTGLDDEETAVETLREGAQDYLVKGEIRRRWLSRAIHYAIERQQILDKLHHLNQELIRSNQELEQFAYIVSHDLQQPLTTIQAFAQLLLIKYEDTLEPQAKHFTERIIAGVKRMNQLIQALLTYSRVGKGCLEFQATDCNSIMNSVLANLQGIIQETSAIINIDKLPIISAEPVQLTQLFQNIIGNALKYHKPDIQPQIKISVNRTGNSWQFEITDNGIGIDPDDFDRVFQIFQRLHPADSYAGTGIGLAICKKIVESHGGTIWVQSKQKMGTTFYWTIPDQKPS